MYFRAWDKVKNCWAKEPIRIDKYGNVFYEDDSSWSYQTQWYPSDNYIIDFNTGITLIDGTETFFGDIIRYTDGNYGYGGEYDKVRDGYVYRVLTKDFLRDFADTIIPYNNKYEFNSDIELVGNIHETELNNYMKLWIRIIKE